MDIILSLLKRQFSRIILILTLLCIKKKSPDSVRLQL